MSKSHLESKPETTSNNLADIIDWLKAGDYVFIHNNYLGGRFFHKNCTRKFEKQADDFADHRVIFVNVKSMPGLLDKGEWDYYITHEGFDDCSCFLRESASDPNYPPHAYHLTLGY